MVFSQHKLTVEFLGDFNKWCVQAISSKQMNLISGNLIGTKDSNNKPITCEMLLGENYLDINENIVGIYIPGKEILSRTALNWFCYLDEDKILTGKFVISKWLHDNRNLLGIINIVALIFEFILISRLPPYCKKD